jgi:Transposase C of IS166 homeodomain
VPTPEALPDDIAALKRIIAEMARDAVSARAEIARLKFQLARYRRAEFGRSSEKLARETEQLELAIEALETDQAERLASAAPEAAAIVESVAEAQKPARRPLPEHLPREEVMHRAGPACRQAQVLRRPCRHRLADRQAGARPHRRALQDRQGSPRRTSGGEPAIVSSGPSRSPKRWPPGRDDTAPAVPQIRTRQGLPVHAVALEGAAAMLRRAEVYIISKYSSGTCGARARRSASDNKGLWTDDLLIYWRLSANLSG